MKGLAKWLSKSVCVYVSVGLVFLGLAMSFPVSVEGKLIEKDPGAQQIDVEKHAYLSLQELELENMRAGAEGSDGSNAITNIFIGISIALAIAGMIIAADALSD